MPRRVSRIALLVMGIVALGPVSALADTVMPGTYTTSLKPRQSVTIEKTVTISQGGPTTAKVDVFFLCDTTGSMGGLINNVIANANTILDDTAALGDVAYGAGEYKDVGDPFVYQSDQDITKDTALVKAGLNLWSANGGGDYPEAGLYGLYQMATAASWRPGSTRLALWFGDAPSWDPAGPAPGVTLAQATDALKAQLIKVEALDLAGLNDYGQAVSIAGATGGNYYSGVDVSQIVTAIQNAITTTFATYSTVSLGTAEVPAGLTVAISPPSYTGEFDRTIDRTFTFRVTFTAVSAGTYRFTMPVLVDGGTMATELDNISVAGTGKGGLQSIFNLLFDSGDAYN